MSECVAVDHGLGVVSVAQIGGGSKEGEVSTLEAVGKRYAMDGKIKQVSFVSEKHFTDLDVYLEHLCPKLTTTFLAMLDDKQEINFWLAVYVRYTQPTKDQSDNEPIVLHSGKLLVTSTLVLARQLDTVIHTR